MKLLTLTLNKLFKEKNIGEKLPKNMSVRSHQFTHIFKYRDKSLEMKYNKQMK